MKAMDVRAACITALVRLALAALLLVPGVALRAADTPPAPPNIVLIMADDIGYGDLGCYGATKIKTPHMDRLAREGRRFTDAHAASAVCSPSRYALLTGAYPFRVDCWGPLNLKNGLLIKPGTTTLASLLKRQGYATACIGKWHLGFGDKAPDWNGELKPGPLEVGFDYYFGPPVVSCFPPYVYVENHRVVGWDPKDPLVFGAAARQNPARTRSYPGKYGVEQVGGARAAHELYREEEFAATLTAKAQAWLRTHRSQPFFLYVATPQIHHPFTPGPQFKGSSACGLYGDFVQEFDWMVGELVRTLDELNLRERTLLIVTSDNGGMLNAEGQTAWKAGHRLNGDLLGFKFDAWEGGHREPYIARWPEHIPAGTVSAQLICHTDLLATFAALTGARLTAAEGPDSLNILPALTGAPAQPIRDQMILAPRQKQHLALREGRWVYIGARGGGGFGGARGHDLGGPAALKFAGEINSDVQDGRFKPDAPSEQLYDLVADPAQARNVVREHPDVAARLKAHLAACQTLPRTAPVAEAGAQTETAHEKKQAQ